MIPSSTELLDWCWANKRPMFPAKVRRDWQYNGAALPQPGAFEEQLSSRDRYDEQKKQSCLGY